MTAPSVSDISRSISRPAFSSVSLILLLRTRFVNRQRKVSNIANKQDDKRLLAYRHTSSLGFEPFIFIHHTDASFQLASYCALHARTLLLPILTPDQ